MLAVALVLNHRILLKRKILNNIYSLGGFKPFHYLNRNGLLILMYHRFSNDGALNCISGDEFDAHLTYLKANSNVIPLGEALEGDSAELPPNAAVITIDDGYRDSYDVAFPLLQKHGFPATLYVITDFLNRKVWLWTDLMRYAFRNTKAEECSIKIEGKLLTLKATTPEQKNDSAGQINEYLKRLPEEEKWDKINGIAQQLGVELPACPTEEFDAITWEQAREMEHGGVGIECHTKTHPILTKIDAARLAVEISDSRTEIESRLDKKVIHFCYPNGAYDETIAAATREAGYQSAVTTNYGFCGPETDVFQLKRIDAQPSIANFAQSVSGFEKFREKIGL